MNLDPASLPAHCDVLVVGAGPAGSAAAQLLARAGRDVVLVDAQAFPRDKVCGDGLIPDAHRALERLGVLEAVMAEARSATTLACIAPRGGRIDVPGRLAVLPRKRLDEIVCRAAVDAGARMFAPLRFVAPVRADGESGAVIGARLRHGDAEHAIRARWVVLATGAQPQATIAAGMCDRRTPSGIALRGYVKNARMAARMTSLEVVWHKRLSPGYGWIFPCGDDVFNIGVGVAQQPRAGRDGRHAMQDVNLREVFAASSGSMHRRRDLIDGGEWQAEPGQELKGAPLRCSLEGAAPRRAGLARHRRGGGQHLRVHRRRHRQGDGDRHPRRRGDPAPASDDATVRADYEARVLALKPRFALYEEANRANAHPWLIDLLVWSAKRSPRRVQRMAGVLEETHIPTDAVTVRGVAAPHSFDRSCVRETPCASCSA